jgi:hypothetical protein
MAKGRGIPSDATRRAVLNTAPPGRAGRRRGVPRGPTLWLRTRLHAGEQRGGPGSAAERPCSIGGGPRRWPWELARPAARLQHFVRRHGSWPARLPWATIARPTDGHLTATLSGRQSFSWNLGRRQRRQDRGGRFLASGATVVGHRFGSGGQKDRGQKNGDQVSDGSEPSFFCRPGFLCLQFRLPEFRTFQRPRMSGDERHG